MKLSRGPGDGEWWLWDTRTWRERRHYWAKRSEHDARTFVEARKRVGRRVRRLLERLKVRGILAEVVG